MIGQNTWDALANPQELPEHLDPLTLIEIATVSLTSPSDAQAMLAEVEKNAPSTTVEPSPEGSPGTVKGMRAAVKLSDQHVELYDDAGKQLYRFPCSSGHDGLTPVGTFAVESKSPSTVSSSDPTISMKWMTRFNGGIGFHGIPVQNGEQLETPLGERPVSAGCIRLADADAKVIYDTLPIGAPVVVQY